jgi:hypothetical protein
MAIVAAAIWTTLCVSIASVKITAAVAGAIDRGAAQIDASKTHVVTVPLNEGLRRAAARLGTTL